MNILNRLKSPVVQIQLISILVGIVIYFAPGMAEQIKIISTAIVGVINILAGLNNPTDKNRILIKANGDSILQYVFLKPY